MIQKPQIKACKMYASGMLKTPMQLKEPFDNRETLSAAIQISISEKEERQKIYVQQNHTGLFQTLTEQMVLSLLRTYP